MRVASGLDATDHGFIQGRGGQGNYRRSRHSLRALPFADRARGGVAVHHRHLDIHQDQIVTIDAEFFDRDRAVHRVIDLVWRFLHVGVINIRLSGESSASRIRSGRRLVGGRSAAPIEVAEWVSGALASCNGLRPVTSIIAPSRSAPLDWFHQVTTFDSGLATEPRHTVGIRNQGSGGQHQDDRAAADRSRTAPGLRGLRDPAIP